MNRGRVGPTPANPVGLTMRPGKGSLRPPAATITPGFGIEQSETKIWLFFNMLSHDHGAGPLCPDHALTCKVAFVIHA
jgi:hypothetical protein